MGGGFKMRIRSAESVIGGNVGCANDDADAAKKEEPPLSARRLMRRRNFAVDQGFVSFAIADNLEEGVSCELGNADFTNTRQMLIQYANTKLKPHIGSHIL